MLNRLIAGLRKNMPATYCNPTHCTMIYRAIINDNKVSDLFFADSNGGRLYRRSAWTAMNELDMLVAVP